MSQLKWSPTALDDLQQIAGFIREYSPAKEQALIGAIIDRANQLRNLPRSGQKRETFADGSESRSLLVGKHYRLRYVVAPNDDIAIIQVLDLRSDQEDYR